MKKREITITIGTTKFVNVKEFKVFLLYNLEIGTARKLDNKLLKDWLLDLERSHEVTGGSEYEIGSFFAKSGRAKLYSYTVDDEINEEGDLVSRTITL